jgi:hypothetical protein
MTHRIDPPPLTHLRLSGGQPHPEPPAQERRAEGRSPEDPSREWGATEALTAGLIVLLPLLVVMLVAVLAATAGGMP